MELYFERKESVNLKKGIFPKKIQERGEINYNNYLKTGYVWQLDRLTGSHEDDGAFYSFYHMGKKAGAIHYTKMQDYLNENVWLDSDYKFKEGDYLQISYSYIHKEIPNVSRPPLLNIWMAFVYQKGIWVYKQYFYELTENIMQGILHLKMIDLAFKEEVIPVRENPLKNVPNRKSRKYNHVRDGIKPEFIYTWSLDRYCGREDDGTFYLQPDIRNFDSAGYITSDVFIKNLNEWKCFGNLDYLPKEGDCVTIRYCFVDFPAKGRPDEPNLLSLQWMQAVFKNEEWVRDRYYHAKFELIAQGVIY